MFLLIQDPFLGIVNSDAVLPFQEAKVLADKTSRKNRALATSTYGLTSKGEMKMDAVRETLSVYRDVKLKNRASLKGKKLLATIQDYYLRRRNKKWAVFPLPLQYDPESELDLRRSLRNRNRYLTNAESILLNVARGEFPGHY